MSAANHNSKASVAATVGTTCKTSITAPQRSSMKDVSAINLKDMFVHCG